MDEIRKKAYKRLLKLLVDTGRSRLYLKKEFDLERIGFVGDLSYLMHNLVKINYTDEWEKFDEAHFWDMFEFLRKRSTRKEDFDLVKRIFNESMV